VPSAKRKNIYIFYKEFFYYILGKIRDHEIENQYASMPMSLIKCTSSC